jgi:hypothetical protein
MIRFCVKMFSVVALLASIGWFAGSGNSQLTQSHSDTVTMNGATTTTTETVVRGDDDAVTADQFHCCLQLDDANYGNPGELVIRGVYEIRQPNLVGSIDDREYTIAVSVRDGKGNTFVDHDPIGTVIDRAGVGHWQQEFRWAMPFLPGTYYVEMMAIVPDTEVTRFNGTIGPALTAYSSFRAIVK